MRPDAEHASRWANGPGQLRRRPQLRRHVHERLATVNPRIIIDVRLLAEPGLDVVLEHVLTGAITTLPKPGIVVVAVHREA